MSSFLAVSPIAGPKAIGPAYGMTRTYCFRFQYTDTDLTRTMEIPANSILENIGIHVAALFNSGTSDVIAIGDEGDPDGYVVSTTSVASGGAFAAGRTIWLDNAPATAILGAYGSDTVTTNVINHWSQNFYTAEETLTMAITSTGTAATTGDVYVFVKITTFDNDQIVTDGQ